MSKMLVVMLVAAVAAKEACPQTSKQFEIATEQQNEIFAVPFHTATPRRRQCEMIKTFACQRATRRRRRQRRFVRKLVVALEAIPSGSRSGTREDDATSESSSSSCISTARNMIPCNN